MELIASAPTLKYTITTSFNHSCDCLIGVYEEEQLFYRTIYFEVTITYSWSGEDELSHVVDYDVIKNSIDKAIRLKKFNLIETVAKIVADVVYDNDTPYHDIYKVSVKAEKGLDSYNYATATYTRGK